MMAPIGPRLEQFPLRRGEDNRPYGAPFPRRSEATTEQPSNQMRRPIKQVCGVAALSFALHCRFPAVD
jgi:hypothetical protein